MESVKCVVVGDGSVGKTCLLIRYATNTFPLEYIPTIFDNYTIHLVMNGKPVNLELWDTAGQEDFDNIRPMSYPKTDICIICYSVTEQYSYVNARQKWFPELQRHAPNAPIILVATKVDERSNNRLNERLVHNTTQEYITHEQGLELMQDISAVMLYECSALNNKGVKHIFEEVVRVALTHRENLENKISKKCCIIS